MRKHILFKFKQQKSFIPQKKMKRSSRKIENALDLITVLQQHAQTTSYGYDVKHYFN